MWICLKAIGGREFAAARDVERLGGDAFVPWEYVQRRARGKMGRPILRAHRAPMLPGYVFCQWRGEIPWHPLRLVEPIIGCLMRDSRPAMFPQSDIDTLKSAAIASAGPAGGKGFRRGDMVRIAAGHPYEGWETRLLEIKDDIVRLEVSALGKLHRVKIPVTAIEKAA